MSARGEVDDWVELEDPEEFESLPVGSDDDLDDSGYAASDDPAVESADRHCAAGWRSDAWRQVPGLAGGDPALGEGAPERQAAR